MLLCNDGLSNKVSKIIRRHIDNMNLLIMYSLRSTLSIYICFHSCLILQFTYLYCYVYVFLCMFMYLHRATWHSSATLTEDFPCFS